jgi:hypothetical protein
MSQPPAAPVSPPVLAGQFQSSSGRTMLQYFRHTFPPGAPSSFRGPVQTSPGFDQVEVFLCGFTLATDVHEANLGRASVNVQKFGYDVQTGMLEVGITTQFVTDGQSWNSEVTFVVVLTDAAAARFSPVSTGCGGTAECNIVRLVGTAVPAGMQYIGIATQIWDAGSRSGPVPVNAISGDINNLSVNPPTVWLDYITALRNGAFTNNMFFEWQGVVIAFDPAEMTRALTSLPYQYTFLANHVATRQAIYSGAQAPANVPTTGFLDAFQGCTLLYSQSINGPEGPIWRIESSASAPIMGPNGAFTQYGVFLGSQFGDTINAVPDYGFQISRAAGFLH